MVCLFSKAFEMGMYVLKLLPRKYLIILFAVLIDTSATETEDETKQSPKRPGQQQRGRRKKIVDKKENKKKGRKSNKDKEMKKNNRQFKTRKLQQAAKKIQLPKTPKVRLDFDW